MSAPSKLDRAELLQSQIARIDARLASFRPFEEWERSADEYVRKFAAEHHGTLRGLYDCMQDSFIEVRDIFKQELEAIRHDKTCSA